MRRLLGVVLALLALGVSVAGAEGPVHPSFPPIKPLVPPLPELKDACGVAVDSKGNVYASDHYHHAIDVSGGSVFGAQFPAPDPLDGSSEFPLDGPCDLAFDSADNLYVNNWHRDVVRFIASPPGSTNYHVDAVIDENHPTSVTVDPASGNLYVVDRTYVAVYEPPILAGEEPVQRIGLGSLGSGYGVAVSDFAGEPGVPSTAGWVYVADASDDTVKVYDPLQDLVHPIRTITGADTPGGSFHLTDSDLAVDPADGHLYVTDNLQPGFEHPELAVHEFSALGHYRGRLPAAVPEGSPTNEVNAGPSAVAIGAGKIFVSAGNFDPDRSFDGSRVLVFGLVPPIETRILSVEKVGAGSGTVTRTLPGWLRCGSACAGEFDLGSTQELAAIPAAHSRFAGWGSFCDELFEGNCIVHMDADALVKAEFEPIPQLELTVAKNGAGSGSVESSPGGIECGVVCAGQFDEQATVTLTAVPATGSRLGGWSGCDAEPEPGRCLVSMDAARSAAAEFDPVEPPPPPSPPEPQRRTLTISSAVTGTASGTVTSSPSGIACGTVCAGVFAGGSAVALVAEPARGSVFLGWGGCDEPSGNRCMAKLGTDETVVAAFAPGFPGPLRVRALRVRGSVADLTVVVPAGGTLAVSGRSLRPIGALPLAAGPVTVRLRLSSAGLRARRRAKDGRLRAKLALSLVPFDGGERVAAEKTVVFGRGAR